MRRELAALVARSPFGQAAAWPVVETVQRDGSASRCSPRRRACDPAVAVQAQQLALRIATELDVAGLLAVELFETDGPRGCWSTSWRCGRTTPGTGRSRARAPRSSSSTCARCSTTRWATRRRRAGGGDGNVLGAAAPAAMRHRRAGAPSVRRGSRTSGAPLRQGGPAGPQDRPRRPRWATDCGEVRARAAPPPVAATGSGPTAGRRTTLTARRSEKGGGLSRAGRRDHGQRLGLAGDGGRRRGAGRVRRPVRGAASSPRTGRRSACSTTPASAAGRGLRVIIAGAGGAAHLPGMVAAATPLPVIGVPVPLKYLDGMDSLLSIVQMPAGVPVATVAIGGARNAGLLAVRILARRPTRSCGPGCRRSRSRWRPWCWRRTPP